MNIEKMLTAEMPDSMVGKVVTSFDTQVSDPDVNVASYGLTKQLNDNLNGFKYYPTGTAIVGLVADDTAYKDSNGNYIIASSTTGQSMIDNVTYKSINSTEDTRGEVGADSATPFKGIKVASGYAGNYGGYQTVNIVCGFKPTKIFIQGFYRDEVGSSVIYNPENDEKQVCYALYNGSGYVRKADIVAGGNSSVTYITSINNDGFSFLTYNPVNYYWWTAIKD